MKSIYFETYGCTTNRAETDVMKGMVKDSGYQLVDSPDKADLVVINTCTVIDKTEKRMLRRIKDFEDKNVVVAGCLASAQPEDVKEIDGDAILLPPDKVGDLLSYMGGETCYRKWDAPTHIDGAIGRVQIADGCKGNCSYCITKKARGKLESSPINSVVSRVEKMVHQGVKEIQLTAQDTAAYGLDINTDIATLINKVTGIKGDYKVRVGMMNPFNTKGIEDEIIDLYKNKKVYNFLHLPLQSGSKKILRKMNRSYSPEYFEQLINKYKRKVGGTVATDIITGFPGETEKDFQKTVDIIKKIEPDIINITRYSPRPGTKAYELKEIKSSEKKKRSKKMTELRKKYGKQNKKKLIGKQKMVLITKKGKKNTYIGRDIDYNPVVVKNPVKIGKKYKIKLDGFTFAYLTGKTTKNKKESKKQSN
ncbi:tRNA (N(6)-L-threonylcarbamoyladenosine(37)-C(2))-methylthiotransferase [Methanonatronarchaeum sp. AMET-Sl]|uniref:tRNA (N(6)-L-threonylcarbamoyladenosine(37)-C(2))- methylthiotransferase n=1 Tax=Methanonatronarchaeum sp. AMET-Sl TaxID=3037654 RepID=UPI00244E3ADF|nr:tRNA (N(6)-L-threonylcarbamoyladenosine(37)-C(2))-methylthiotransferase [Methanonatronarchaeum sp. AMET-Sl]WGI17418.1 tRNA (N(6)-L-threonylcarbamoyladenosine(37)-C(2))-methylthiotransferase [Methanonatronarchaeum sp. AMET-Sl]